MFPSTRCCPVLPPPVVHVQHVQYSTAIMPGRIEFFNVVVLSFASTTRSVLLCPADNLMRANILIFWRGQEDTDGRVQAYFCSLWRISSHIRVLNAKVSVLTHLCQNQRPVLDE